jgi:hemoglobin
VSGAGFACCIGKRSNPVQFDFPPVKDETQRAAIEDAIGQCVQAFYEKGIRDPLLRSVFVNSIPDLESHLKIVRDFWSRSLLGTERYEGQPFAAHVKLPIEPEHFKRWLELFVETARETLPDTQAEQAVAKATHMTQCFQSGLFPFTGPDGKPSRSPPQ